MILPDPISPPELGPFPTPPGPLLVRSSPTLPRKPAERIGGGGDGAGRQQPCHEATDPGTSTCRKRQTQGLKEWGAPNKLDQSSLHQDAWASIQKMQGD